MRTLSPPAVRWLVGRDLPARDFARGNAAALLMAARRLFEHRQKSLALSRSDSAASECLCAETTTPSRRLQALPDRRQPSVCQPAHPHSRATILPFSPTCPSPPARAAQA